MSNDSVVTATNTSSAVRPGVCCIVARKLTSARWVIFTPGGACLRLYSLRSTRARTCSTVPGSNPDAIKSAML